MDIKTSVMVLIIWIICFALMIPTAFKIHDLIYQAGYDKCKTEMSSTAFIDKK